MPGRCAVPILLHVQADGSGPPLLLLPTFASAGESWGVAVVRALSEHFFVLRPDWPGVGASVPSPDHSVSIAALARAALSAADAYTAEPVRLLGWGLGALVALQMATDHPDRVERVAVIGGSPHGKALLERAPTVAALCQVPDCASAEEHMLGLLSRMVSPAWRPFAEMFLAQLLPRPARTLRALRDQWSALQAYDLRSTLPEVRAPTLVMVGEADALTPPEHAKQLQAAIPGARFRAIASAGHAAIWEQPLAVLDAAAPFLVGDAIAGEADTEQQSVFIGGKREVT